MPGYSDTAKNLMLTQLGTSAGFVSLHTATPGTTGAAEVSNVGVYDRQAITWGSAAGGSIVASNQPVFSVPEATTISHFGLWSAAAGGTFYGGSALSAAETFAAQGQYTLTSVNMDLNGV